MLGILREFFEKYYGQSLNIKTQPGYFPFTEPSLEFLIEKPKALGGKGGDWLEMLGCGMIHPNVLKMAGIDPTQYQAVSTVSPCCAMASMMFATSNPLN